MAEPAHGPEPRFELVASRHFASWLAEQGTSLAFTTYQSGKLVMLGTGTGGRLAIFERTFNRCMGLCHHDGALYMSTLYQLWRFDDMLEPGQAHDGYDRLFVPRVGWTTGDLDIHDIAVDARGRVLFVNTLFGCLATLSERYSFEPLWQPPFLSRLGAEDRCHLNGLALEAGTARYMTAVSRSDVADGWRDRRRDGGVVMELPTGETVCEGLSMPHSPRVYRDRLWLLDSGNGHFGYVDRDHGRFEPVAFCPGYLRGLAFVGDYAVVGTSLARENRTFQGLALDEALAAKGAEARCGLHVIDLRSGDTVHWVRLEGVVQELYDVVALPGVRRPKMLGFVSSEIQRMVSVAPAGAL